MHLIFLSIFLTFIASGAELISSGNGEDVKEEYDTSLILIRKCCPSEHFYSTEGHECLKVLDNNTKFHNHTATLLLGYVTQTVRTISQKIDSCPGTHGKPQILPVLDPYSHVILEDGSVYDYNLNVSYNIFYYCLEMVGSNYEDSLLMLAYCERAESVYMLKCCPKDHFYDTRTLNCSPYYNPESSHVEESLLKALPDSSELTYQLEFSCKDLPVKVSLTEATFRGKKMCITRNDYCYSLHEFCVENMLKDNENELVQAAFICPNKFINKCCPEGQSLYDHGCADAPRQSLSLVHFLENSRYQNKGLSSHDKNCNSLTIEDNTRSDIKWFIDSGEALIVNNNTTIRTQNYCIDDFVNEDEVFLVIKVCSEEVHVYHEVSEFIDWSQNILGKCCRSGQMYQLDSSNQPKCVGKPEGGAEILGVIRKQANHSRFVYTNFAFCDVGEQYLKYDLIPSFNDYAELTEDRYLKVINKENNCIVKESQIEKSKFCIDLIQRENVLKPVAIVCSPRDARPHTEKDAIVVSLAGISCTALISAFFSLAFMRVRRGMITVKKIKTLAGRILSSYVLSQFAGYLVLSIVHLSQYEDGKHTTDCFVLTGFLVFFMLAAFCWNTSICIEGLLLTMHTKVPESHRYICHSIWAWGTPALITAITLIKDAKRDLLPCDSITPKIGVNRCFFSDQRAHLLYFCLPITITVVLNGLLLLSARFLRNKKLKKLEKDPNRKHEPLHQVLSKSIKNKIRGEPSVKPVSNHSGLRTHHNKNIWIEALKLAMWSGTTWIMEFIGILVPIYLGRPQGEWYNYMWYLPVGFNCLRGLGIFIIISFTADNTNRLMRTAHTIGSSFSATMSRFMTTVRFKDSSGQTVRKQAPKLTKKFAGHPVPSKFPVPFKGEERQENAKVERSRNTSVSTVVTNISSSSLNSPLSDNSESQNPTFFHSVSQFEHEHTLPDVFENCEDFENDFEVRAKESKDIDNQSLDNTSMENVFWETDLRNKRNESQPDNNFVIVHSCMAEEAVQANLTDEKDFLSTSNARNIKHSLSESSEA